MSSSHGPVDQEDSGNVIATAAEQGSWIVLLFADAGYILIHDVPKSRWVAT